MGYGSWRTFDRSLQKDIEKAKRESPEAGRKAEKEAGHFYATTGGAQAGVLAGALAGSVVPVVGTFFGAIVGGLIGGLTGHTLSK